MTSKNLTAASNTNEAANLEPTVRIGVLIHDLARMSKALFNQAAKELGVTRAQWWALSNLSWSAFEGVSQSDLAGYLNVGEPAVSQLVNRLVENGMIKRLGDVEDRRKYHISITDYGYEIISRMSPITATLNDISFDGISENDIKVANRVLDKIKHNLQEAFWIGAELNFHGSSLAKQPKF